ncbi:hypothetical protein D3C75_1263520 [compost metagenome]
MGLKIPHLPLEVGQVAAFDIGRVGDYDIGRKPGSINGNQQIPLQEADPSGHAIQLGIPPRQLESLV